MEWLSLLAWGLMPILVAQAELPQSRLYAISPSGGRIGEEFELTLTAGEDLEEIKELVFSHPGISARPKSVVHNQVEAVIPNVFLVKIDRDVAPGLYEVSCAGLWGLSNPRSFAVGERVEIRDVKDNESPQAAMPVPLESVINNTMRIAGDVDWYRITGRQGQRIILDCLAERIDSRFDGVISIYDSQGRRRLASANNVQGDDPVVVFDVPRDGDYLVKVHDLTYRHGAEFHYRLEIHTGPYVEFADPSAGTAGQTTEVTLFGYNLPGSEPDAGKIGGAFLERLKVSVACPDLNASVRLEGRIPPLAAGTDTFTYRHRTERGISNPVRIGLTPWPVALEQEPNDEQSQIQTLAVPLDVSGSFGQPGDRDQYQFAARAGEKFSVEVYAERLGSLADPILTVERLNPAPVTGSNPGPLSVQDDGEPSFNANYFETKTIDPSFRFTADESGLYRVTLQDCYRETRGGPELRYRLVIHRSEPDFRLVALPGAARLGQVWPISLRRLDRFPVTVYAYRRDGFDGAILVEPKQLPDGIDCPAVTIGSNSNSATLILSSKAEAIAGTFDLAFQGTAEVNAPAAGGTPVKLVRPVRMASTIWGYHGIFPAMCRLTDQQRMSILGELAPFELTTEVAEVHVDQGSVLELPIRLARKESCADAIKLAPQNLPDQVKNESSNQVIPKTEDRCDVRLRVGPETAPGAYTIYVQGDSDVSYRRNPAAAERLKLAHQQAKDAATAAMQLAQAASKQKNDALHAQDLATRKLQQAQGTAAAQSQSLDAARMEFEKTSTALRQAAEALAQAEERLATANHDFAEADASRQEAEKTFAPFETAARQAEQALQQSRAQLQRVRTEAAASAVPNQSPPVVPLPRAFGEVSLSDDSLIESAQKDVEKCEMAWRQADQARRTARPVFDAAIAAFDAQMPIQLATMNAHKQAFQLHDVARQKNASQQQLVTQSEQAVRLAQQALMRAQEELNAAEKSSAQAATMEKTTRTVADDAETRRRDAEMKANEATQSAEPRNVSVSSPSTPVKLVVHAAAISLDAEVENNGSLQAGKKLNIHVKLQRQNGFVGAVRIVAAGLKESGGIAAEPVELPPGTNESLLTLVASDTAESGARPEFKVRAECEFSGRLSVIEVPLCVHVARTAP
jgi:hypothetical protein